MVNLYKRTINLLKEIAKNDPTYCPDCDVYEKIILEARAILEEINKI
jgi:hypothetical protein